MTTDAPEQARYQVRFDWAATGARAIGSDADVIIWVDAATLPVPPVLAHLPADGAIVTATIRDAAVVASWVVELQQRLARRIVIAIVAAGKPRRLAASADEHTRFAVEDLLASGAVIDQLAKLGLDATSPEAAAAEGAFLHLGRAVGHLMSASVTAQSAGAMAMATATATAAGSFRINLELTSADVVVLREHAETVSATPR
ncbi:MAG: hypothetical protein H7248_02675 [Microbacteriaceae bacterium]|nr:hypothetical protein [Microbacteriaceae bacterium]